MRSQSRDFIFLFTDVVVTDIYASPLSALSWDDYADQPTISLPVPTEDHSVVDNMPRIKARPKSFMAKGPRPSASGTSAPKRTLPDLPAIYDTPPALSAETDNLLQYDSPRSHGAHHYDSPQSLQTYDTPTKSVSVKSAKVQNGSEDSEYYNTTPTLSPSANKAGKYFM